MAFSFRVVVSQNPIPVSIDIDEGVFVSLRFAGGGWHKPHLHFEILSNVVDGNFESVSHPVAG